jgi:hypothetical protein
LLVIAVFASGQEAAPLSPQMDQVDLFAQFFGSAASGILLLLF